MIKRLVLLRLTACLIFAVPVAARAQETPAPTPSLPASVEKAKWFDPAAATQAWLATVPADKRAKSDAYFEGGYWLILWNFLAIVAISIFLLQSRISARLRDFAERTTAFKAMQVVSYGIPYFILAWVLSFPLNAYEYFFREHQYGMATQNFAQWFREELIGLSVTLVAGAILLIAL
ncbi:MAG: hypothetical protein DMF46_02335, partial [Verrucomicrobia bacterium]